MFGYSLRQKHKIALQDIIIYKLHFNNNLVFFETDISTIT